MAVPKEAWLFDSHKSSKRSQWLQSTLSELEDKTKGIMKLIEGDADTFAQRAEMYYMKRPELVSMIEDFYRAYRSLAEKYDQLKMESGDTFSNRGWFCKDWNSTDRSFESPSVVSEYMVSEVEDPESEDDQVESRLRESEVANKNNGDLAMLTNEVVLEGRVKENLYELFTDSVDSMWEVGYPKSEAAVNRSKLREFPEKMNYYGAIYTLTEEVKHIDSEVSNIADKSSKHSDFVQREPDVDCDSEDLVEDGKSDLLSLSIKETWTIRTKTNTAAEVSSEHFMNSSELKVCDPEIGESKREVVLEKMSDSDVVKLMSRVEKLQDESVKSLSSEHFMNSSELKVYDPELREARDESKLKVMLEKKSDSDATKLMSRVEKLQDENVKSLSSEHFMNSLELKVYDPELGEARDESKLIVMLEKKSDSDATKLMSRVEELQDENVTFMADLARKDEEKREVIRQLSLFMDMLRQENIRLRKLVKESNSKGGLFTKPLKNLKGIFGGKLFGSHHSKYQTTLVAL